MLLSSAALAADEMSTLEKLQRMTSGTHAGEPQNSAVPLHELQQRALQQKHAEAEFAERRSYMNERLADALPLHTAAAVRALAGDGLEFLDISADLETAIRHAGVRPVPEMVGLVEGDVRLGVAAPHVVIVRPGGIAEPLMLMGKLDWYGREYACRYQVRFSTKPILIERKRMYDCESFIGEGLNEPFRRDFSDVIEQVLRKVIQ